MRTSESNTANFDSVFIDDVSSIGAHSETEVTVAEAIAFNEHVADPAPSHQQNRLLDRSVAEATFPIISQTRISSLSFSGMNAHILETSSMKTESKSRCYFRLSHFIP